MDSKVLINYMIEAEPHWYIRRKTQGDQQPSEKERSLTKKLFEAIATAKHVEYVDIDGNQFANEEFSHFVDSLRTNESITSLRIVCKSDEDPARATELTNRMLSALASRPISLVTLDMPWGADYSDDGVRHLVQVIRCNPDLQELRLCGSINDGDAADIVNQLRESCKSLVSFYISGDFSLDTLYLLAEFAGQSRILKSVTSSTSMDFDELTERQMDEIRHRLGDNNTKLVDFSTWSSKRLDLLAQNKQRAIKEQEEDRRKKYLEFQQNKKNHVSEYVHEANYDVLKFPSDLMFPLLVYNGMLGSISAFFKTCKHWRAIGNKSYFWKSLAMHVLPVVEAEVLEIAEVYYAEHVQKYGLENSNFWAILLKHHYWYQASPQARWAAVGVTDITAPKRLPFHHPQPSPFLHEQLLTALFRRYPGLMANTNTCEITTVNGLPSLNLNLAWSTSVYLYFHIVIQTFNDAKVSGIFLVSYQKKDPLRNIERSLDYFTATSLEEALVKSKRMIETFYVTTGRWIDNSRISYSTASLLMRAGEKHSQLRDQIHNNFAAFAERIIEQFDLDGEKVDAIIRLTQLIVKQLKDQPAVSNTDLLDKKYKLPSRNTLHTLYSRSDLKDVSFVSAGLDSVTGHEFKPIRPQPKKKSRNSSLKGTLMKCMRVLVNFIVMPVLQALWPRHVREMDQAPTPFQFTLPDGLYRHYYENFKPFSGVTVDNAAPSCWPMTALVIATRIAEQVGQIVEQLVGLQLKRIGKEEARVNELVQQLVLDENLIPPKHVAGFRQVINRILEFS